MYSTIISVYAQSELPYSYLSMLLSLFTTDYENDNKLYTFVYIN